MMDYTYPVDDPRIRREAVSLSKMGFDVTVFGAASQGGKQASEQLDGVQFISVPVFTQLTIGSVSKMIIQLIRNDVGDMTPDTPQVGQKLRTLFTLIFINLWAIRLGFSKRCDVVHSHNWHYVPAARFLRAVYRARSIHETHESPYVEFGNRFITSFI